ncbi:hypothetical protein [Corynebacterium urealyticum]|uniref:Membrane protein YkvI n=1 Tax=Corynebacterium urealyticum TaxID=43771 RepID=A0A5D4FXE8_9CORY|nr:hypothetical protein [Corynebacterium urealyticum]TYR20633.1 hypothetical protein FYJ87_06760 [Corynebacterium urealyticum]
MRSIKIGLALVGLLVGAGFATGKEVTQYFVSFGTMGVWGVLVAAITTAGAAIVAMTAGSFFLAEEHSSVFNRISHPIISKVMDAGATVTQFAIGFIMIAGAGAVVEQQWGIQPWIGALSLTVIIALVGLLDVDRVSTIIGGATPLIVVVILIVFVWVLLNKPDDSFTELAAIGAQNESPVRPWWLSALNYTGMTLATGISMILVIGGDSANMQNAIRGGLLGGLIYSTMVVIEVIMLLLAAPLVLGSDVPILALTTHIAPWFSHFASVVVVFMVFNTALGMFYALGRRLTAKKPEAYRPVYLLGVLVGFGVSFVGFGDLVNIVFPILGWIGMVIVGALILWRFKTASRIEAEGKARSRIWKYATAPAKASTRDLRRIATLIRGTAPENERFREKLQDELEQQHEGEGEYEDSPEAAQHQEMLDKLEEYDERYAAQQATGASDQSPDAAADTPKQS